MFFFFVVYDPRERVLSFVAYEKQRRRKEQTDSKIVKKAIDFSSLRVVTAKKKERRRLLFLVCVWFPICVERRANKTHTRYLCDSALT